MDPVIIMRGPSGSGKSRFVTRNFSSARWLSADHFFLKLEPSGKTTYEFNPARIGEAHADCFRKYMKALYVTWTEPIVIDNTNIRLWEMENYIWLAKKFERKVEIYSMMESIRGLTAEDLTRRNTHGVPQEVIQKMIDLYEPHPQEMVVYQ